MKYKENWNKAYSLFYILRGHKTPRAKSSVPYSFKSGWGALVSQALHYENFPVLSVHTGQFPPSQKSALPKQTVWEGQMCLKRSADFLHSMHSLWEPPRLFSSRFESGLPFMNEEAEGQKGELLNSYNLLHVLDFNTQSNLIYTKHTFSSMSPLWVEEINSILQMERLRSMEMKNSLWFREKCEIRQVFSSLWALVSSPKWG